MVDPDDTDARFRALIEAEYGDQAIPAGQPDPDDAAAGEPGEEEPPKPAVPFSALPTPRSWVPAEEEEEPFVPPAIEPAAPMSPAGLLAVVLLVGSALVGVAMIARIPLPWWVPPAGLVCFVVGIGLGFSRLRHDDGDPGDGAVV